VKTKKTGFFKNIGFFLKTKWSEPSSRIFFLLGTLPFLLGILMYVVETINKTPDTQINSLFDTVWWLFVTITTVGYGDYVPKSIPGKLVGIATLIAGISVFSIFSGSVASVLVDLRLKERRGLGKVNLKDHILILGWNQNLDKIITSIPLFLGNRNFNLVLVNDGSEDDYDEIRSKFMGFNIRFVHGDFTKESVLKRANIDFASTVIVIADVYGKKLIDDADERTLLAVLTIKAINPEIKIFCEVIKQEKMKHIVRAGADNIIQSSEFNPILISSSLVSPAMPTFFRELIVNYDEPKVRLESIPKSYIGKNFNDLFKYFRERAKGMVVALLTTERELTIDDLLTSDNAIDAFIRAKFQEAEQGYFEGEEEKYKVKINPDDSYVLSEEDSLAFVIY
jgi:voltage-gated potassium channel